MKRWLMLIALTLAVCGLTAPAGANPVPDIFCGFEGGETVLDLFGTGEPPILAENVGDVFYGGDSSLRLIDNSPSGTPQAYIAYIWGLTDGQEITAGFWRYDDTPGAAPSCRIWGHWNDELPENPGGYNGSAGGNSDYGPGTGWDETTHTWTVEGGHTGLVIEVRVYSNAGDTVWIDDLWILPPGECTIQTPCEIVVPVRTTTFSEVKALYR
jgi:hypothetical protein